MPDLNTCTVMVDRSASITRCSADAGATTVRAIAARKAIRAAPVRCQRRLNGRLHMIALHSKPGSARDIAKNVAIDIQCVTCVRPSFLIRKRGGGQTMIKY